MAHEEGFEDLLSSVLTAHVPDCLSLEKIERLSGGASQETYRLIINTSIGQRKLAMRRARGGSDDGELGIRPGLDVEAALFNHARAAGIPEPRVHHVLEENDGLGQGFIMEWIDGEALGAKISRSPDFENQRKTLAFECGVILARIHSIDLASTSLDRVLQVVTPKSFVMETWERYQSFQTPQPMLDYTARWLLDHLPEDGALTLVHNDFRNGNFMVDPVKGIVAVLDWELAHIGDPMRDLGWLCTNSWRFGVADKPVGGFGTREELFAGYESVTGKSVDAEHVKFWEVFGSFWWSTTCLGMVEMHRNGNDPSVERPAIGRRSSEGQIDCVNLLFSGPVSLPSSLVSPSQEMPRPDELLVSVRDFLRGEVMEETRGRTQFLGRVAANSLDIVLRELELGPDLHDYQVKSLSKILKKTGSRDELMQTLCERLRIPEAEPLGTELQVFLRNSVAGQVAIDQPRYSGLTRALAEA